MTGVRMESLIVADAPDGERVDFERRLGESRRLVFQIAYSALASAADAEEVAQEVFLRAYRKLKTLREPEKFRAWVARMSWRLALNRLRASRRTLARDTAWFECTASPPASAETLAAEREFRGRLRQEIDRLPEKLRSVLLLSAIDEQDARSVAAILEIPEGTVRSRLHLARKQLLRRFSP